MKQNDQSLEGALVSAISDGFNRAMHALEEAGAVDSSEMRRHYHGVGSAYYDLVTLQIEEAARVCADSVREAVSRENG
jgi:hypothetical protein